MQVYWLEQTAADVPADNDWLGPSETVRLDGLRFPKRRADWRLGRWTAKLALAGYLNLPGHRRALAKIEVRPEPSGAPAAFLADEAAPVTISLSHRAGRAACAIARPGVALGCDLEIIEQHSDAFMADYFTADEQALAARASATDRPRLLSLLWSAKESGLKALRTGLRLDTRSIVVTFVDAASPNTWFPLHVRDSKGQGFHGWWYETGGLLRTMAAVPQPARPILVPLPPTAAGTPLNSGENLQSCQFLPAQVVYFEHLRLRKIQNCNFSNPSRSQEDP
jgi:4'-phosphopantetheinyl transferase